MNKKELTNSIVELIEQYIREEQDEKSTLKDKIIELGMLAHYDGQNITTKQERLEQLQ